MINIISNGSKWAGEEPDTIDVLLKRLEEYTLDPVFGEFMTLLDNGKIMFFGNFFDYSHVFRIETDDSEICEKLTNAIVKNTMTDKYLEAADIRSEQDRELKERFRTRGFSI